MKDFVKNVFTILMCTVIALALYFIFFGQEATGWKGAVYFAADSVECAMAEYYYDYSYLPSAYRTLDVDLALNGHLQNTLGQAAADLSASSHNEIVTFTSDFNVGSVNVKYATQGWIGQ